ncbi:MAG TPA: hypothetical protein VGL46_02280 [Pseudonocardiaceae bacterium]
MTTTRADLLPALVRSAHLPVRRRLRFLGVAEQQRIKVRSMSQNQRTALGWRTDPRQSDSERPGRSLIRLRPTGPGVRGR